MGGGTPERAGPTSGLHDVHPTGPRARQCGRWRRLDPRGRDHRTPGRWHSPAQHRPLARRGTDQPRRRGRAGRNLQLRLEAAGHLRRLLRPGPDGGCVAPRAGVADGRRYRCDHGGRLGAGRSHDPAHRGGAAEPGPRRGSRRPGCRACHQRRAALGQCEQPTPVHLAIGSRCRCCRQRHLCRRGRSDAGDAGRCPDPGGGGPGDATGHPPRHGVLRVVGTQRSGAQRSGAQRFWGGTDQAAAQHARLRAALPGAGPAGLSVPDLR